MEVYLNIEGEKHQISDQDLTVVIAAMEDAVHNQPLLDQLSHHPQYSVRLAVSEKKYLGPETVAHLMNDISSEIHMNIISSPAHLQSAGVTVDILLECVAQGVIDILTEIAQNIDQLPYDDSEKTPLIEALASHHSARVRHVLAGNTFLPVMWLEKLRDDVDIHVAHRAERSLNIHFERLRFKGERGLGDGMCYSDLSFPAGRMCSMSDLMLDNYRQLEDRYAASKDRNSTPGFNGEKGDRLLTGFDGFDQISGGLRRRELSIIAGAKGAGLSTLALNIAVHNGLHNEEHSRVAIFSADMPSDKLSMRLLSIKSGITMACIETGEFNSSDWRAFASASGALAEANMHVSYAPNISVYEIRSSCLRMKKEGKEFALLVIDNLEMLNSYSDPTSREEEFDEMARVLKQLAFELNAPVLALAGIKQAGMVPTQSDFRIFSRVLNKETDTILLLYRQGKFAELNIVKHPELSSGKASLLFNEKILKFEGFTLS